MGVAVVVGNLGFGLERGGFVEISERRKDGLVLGVVNIEYGGDFTLDLFISDRERSVF